MIRNTVMSSATPKSMRGLQSVTTYNTTRTCKTAKPRRTQASTYTLQPVRNTGNRISTIQQPAVVPTTGDRTTRISKTDQQKSVQKKKNKRAKTRNL